MFRINTEFLEIDKKKINNLVKKWSKELNKHVTEETQILYKLLQR